MGFKDVSSGFDNTLKGTAMNVGDSVTGYLTEINEREGENGTMHSFILVNDGKKTLFYPAGNIKYMIQDGKLATGVLTRITRIDDKVIGKGKFKKNSSQFRVEQDSSAQYTVA